MILIIQNGYSCDYEARLFAGLFFSDNEEVTISQNFDYSEKIINVYTHIVFEGKSYFEDYSFEFDKAGKSEKLIKKIFTASCTKSLSHAAMKIRKINFSWGVMCGIRPAKNARQLYEEGCSRQEVRDIFRNVYEVSEEKTELALTVAENEKQLLENIGKNSVSLYIGIPFCPTRCVYCSFVSTDIRVSGKYMAEFVDKLELEIEKTGKILRDNGLYAENIYIGGGTPTTLTAEYFERIFRKLYDNFDLDRLIEFTVEAGRPDTITSEKLEVLKKYGVNRISINPQSMNDNILKKIGRSHSSEMIYRAYEEARKIGFSVINTDLIAGLPDETPEMFERSLDKVIELKPENITVHSLCLKKKAYFKMTDNELAKSEYMNRMLSYTQKRMKEEGYVPYYMYRQKNSSGNLENVGYAKPGTMSVYNVNIMEEKQTIIAMGGGGSSKAVTSNGITRVFNFKDPLEYIRRFDEILLKKDEISEILKNG
ncbi:MAG: coproporphyrinogen dehydrogenase HemZ [Clostridiales bacterium]|nr:coproporphyrinogen dehydrogenase HemZ [Clostridiales bacterium]